MTWSSTEKVRRTIRLSNEEVQAVLERMESQREHGNDADRRLAPRYRYNRGLVVAHLKQPGSVKAVPYQVPTRNLSKTGIALLHGGFVHVGTEYIIHLIARDGTWQSVPGRAVRCAFVESNIHEVGVEFNIPIELSHFCCLDHDLRAFVLGEGELARTIGKHAQSIGCDTVEAASQGDLSILLAGEPFDAAFVLNASDDSGDSPTAPQVAMAAGYDGLMIAIARQDDPIERERCLLAGCDLLMPNPPTRDNILCTLTFAETIKNSHRSRPEPNEVGVAFLKAIPATLRALETAIRKHDQETLDSTLIDIQEHSKEAGLPEIYEGASSLAKALRHVEPATDLRSKVEELIEVCLAERFFHKAVLSRHVDEDTPDEEE